jgi:hypothetical protein
MIQASLREIQGRLTGAVASPSSSHQRRKPSSSPLTRRKPLHVHLQPRRGGGRDADAVSAAAQSAIRYA